MGAEPDATCRDVAACEQACDRGSAGACVAAGIKRHASLGGSGLALRDFARACRLGNVLGCTNYGATLLLGERDPQASACAARLFSLACDHSEANGCAMLGWAYIRGEGVPRDREKALGALLRGCRPSLTHTGGVVMACQQLIELMQASHSADPLVKRVIQRAHRIACNAGSSADCSALHGAAP